MVAYTWKQTGKQASSILFRPNKLLVPTKYLTDYKLLIRRFSVGRLRTTIAKKKYELKTIIGKSKYYVHMHLASFYLAKLDFPATRYWHSYVRTYEGDR